ncbi:carbohydrate kinase [Mycetocola sp. 2940]|uniref:carbohydrate kinase family protein n=1 Tax=Mycetocola sp. 2940 TaxID=3156452 RepID=UPI003391C75D
MSNNNIVPARSDVLVVGETIIDIVERGGVRTEHVGGSPANVALTLGRLGHSVRLVTHLADDDRGRRARAHLAESHVAVISRDAERTPTAVARIQADGSAHYTFDIAWDPVTPEVGGAVHVHVGSIAAFLAPGAEKVRELLMALPAGVTSSFDPNIRPSIIGLHHEVLEQFEALASVSEVVKLSDEDALWLYPSETPERVIAGLLALGVRLAVITRGGDGLLLASRQASIDVPAARITVADTIGSGDSAMGAIIDGVRQEGLGELTASTLRRIGGWAATVAGVTTSRVGANPPWLWELVENTAGVAPSACDM